MLWYNDFITACAQYFFHQPNHVYEVLKQQNEMLDLEPVVPDPSTQVYSYIIYFLNLCNYVFVPQPDEAHELHKPQVNSVYEQATLPSSSDPAHEDVWHVAMSFD